MFKQLLQRYGPALEKTMKALVDDIDDAPVSLKYMLQYPMGWIDATGAPYEKTTGKRVRPLILLLCAEATGGEWKRALSGAAAIEFIHNFSLIHDDIQDNSPVRHARPTVWNVWGRAHAINAGDAMFALAYRALEQLSEHGHSPEVMLEIWRVFNHAVLELTRGQHLDMQFEVQDTVTIDAYLSMIGGKTGALLASSAQIGALAGCADVDVAKNYASFGLNLGLAFQIRDDILGIWGDPSQTGKSAATDILSRKKSLPVLYGLANSEALRDIYLRDPFTEQEVTEAVALLDQIGARDYTINQEETYFNAAVASLKQANPQGEAGDQLRQMVELLFQRAY